MSRPFFHISPAAPEQKGRICLTLIKSILFLSEKRELHAGCPCFPDGAPLLNVFHQTYLVKRERDFSPTMPLPAPVN